MKRIICKKCLKSSKRIKGLGRYCSEECRKFHVPKCKPECKEFETATVVFSNGQPHTKTFCKICREGFYGEIITGHPTSVKICGFDKQKFYTSHDWARVRYKILKNSDGKCTVCRTDKSALTVDHIKPLWKFPELALVESNLQVLCRLCNWGKFGDIEPDRGYPEKGDITL